MNMKCPECHVTMVKDTEIRMAECPMCGRTKSYKTKGDKKRERQEANEQKLLNYYLQYQSEQKLETYRKIIIAQAIAIAFLILLLIFGEDLFRGIGAGIIWLFQSLWWLLQQIGLGLWAVLKFIGNLLWSGIAALWHLIFG